MKGFQRLNYQSSLTRNIPLIVWFASQREKSPRYTSLSAPTWHGLACCDPPGLHLPLGEARSPLVSIRIDSPPREKNPRQNLTWPASLLRHLLLLSTSLRIPHRPTSSSALLFLFFVRVRMPTHIHPTSLELLPPSLPLLYLAPCRRRCKVRCTGGARSRTAHPAHL